MDYSQPEEEWGPLERCLQQTLHELLSLGIQTTRVEGSKLEGAGDPVYNDVPAGLVGSTFRSTLSELENLSHLAQEDTKKSYIPFSILEAVDKGQNPATYTRELIERTSSENQFANAGLENLKLYHSLLVEQVANEFPQLASSLQKEEVS